MSPILAAAAAHQVSWLPGPGYLTRPLFRCVSLLLFAGLIGHRWATGGPPVARLGRTTASSPPDTGTSSTQPGAVSPAPGMLRADVPRFRLALSSFSGIREVVGESGSRFGRYGRATLPAGTYTVMRCVAEARDAAGRRWEARGGVWPRPITITPGRETALQLTGPLRAELRGLLDVDPMTFRLEFTGSQGELFGGVTVDGRQPEPPRLRIRDARGRTVAELPFKYG